MGAHQVNHDRKTLQELKADFIAAVAVMAVILLGAAIYQLVL
jgi:hypothetical protein